MIVCYEVEKENTKHIFFTVTLRANRNNRVPQL